MALGKCACGAQAVFTVYLDGVGFCDKHCREYNAAKKEAENKKISPFAQDFVRFLVATTAARAELED